MGYTRYLIKLNFIISILSIEMLGDDLDIGWRKEDAKYHIPFPKHMGAMPDTLLVASFTPKPVHTVIQ